ncbi:hypothetical protein BJ508DRAFT_349750 [Ascobolus immersus RN42]|uniref:C2H2-type domain-containing protein n=1 Tax=Ascobolus immersus RN42 TaxID=1160509 RepID=A0A3N4I1V8_ASCIM|nr:hypothetical protein BJ508DRAFT_349750 [Ascobolus immersus RN42]
MGAPICGGLGTSTSGCLLTLQRQQTKTKHHQTSSLSLFFSFSFSQKSDAHFTSRSSNSSPVRLLFTSRVSSMSPADVYNNHQNPRYRQVWNNAHGNQRAYPIGQTPPYQIHPPPVPTSYFHRQHPITPRVPQLVSRPSSERKIPQYAQQLYEDDLYDRRYEPSQGTPGPRQAPIFNRQTLRQQQLDRMMQEQQNHDAQLLQHHQRQQLHLKIVQQKQHPQASPTSVSRPSPPQPIHILQRTTPFEKIQQWKGTTQTPQPSLLQRRPTNEGIRHHSHHGHSYGMQEMSGKELEEFAEWHLAYFEASVDDCDQAVCRHGKNLREQYANYRASSHGQAQRSLVGPQQAVVSDTGDRPSLARTLSRQLLSGSSISEKVEDASGAKSSLVLTSVSNTVTPPLSPCHEFQESDAEQHEQQEQHEDTMVQPQIGNSQRDGYEGTAPLLDHTYGDYLKQFGPWPHPDYAKDLKKLGPVLLDGAFDDEEEPDGLSHGGAVVGDNSMGHCNNTYPGPPPPPTVDRYARYPAQEGNYGLEDQFEGRYGKRNMLVPLDEVSPEMEKLVAAPKQASEPGSTQESNKMDWDAYDDMTSPRQSISSLDGSEDSSSTVRQFHDGVFPCIICGVNFTDRASIRQHFLDLDHCTELQLFLREGPPSHIPETQYAQAYKDLEIFEATILGVHKKYIRARNHHIMAGNAFSDEEIHNLTCLAVERHRSDLEFCQQFKDRTRREEEDPDKTPTGTPLQTKHTTEQSSDAASDVGSDLSSSSSSDGDLEQTSPATTYSEEGGYSPWGNYSSALLSQQSALTSGFSTPQSFPPTNPYNPALAEQLYMMQSGLYPNSFYNPFLPSTPDDYATAYNRAWATAIGTPGVLSKQYNPRERENLAFKEVSAGGQVLAKEEGKSKKYFGVIGEGMLSGARKDGDKVVGKRVLGNLTPQQEFRERMGSYGVKSG